MKACRNLFTHRLNGLGVALAAVMLTAACSFGPFAQNQAAEPARSATLAKGTLIATVGATGSLQPEAELKVNFQQPGTVAQVNVRAGDAVKKGDVLARLDTTDLDLALAQAQAALGVATANYSRTVEGPRQTDIDAAQAALNAAQANYSKVKAGPAQVDYADAEAALHNAEALLQQAQDAYNMAYSANPAGIGASPAALQLEQATNNYNAVKARYDRATKGADRAQISAAWQQVQSAKASLDRLQQPTKQFDIDQAHAQIRQAQIQVDQARRRIAQAALVAPRDGVVSAVNVKAGEIAGAQAPVTLVDTSRLHIDVTIDEIDIAKLKPGQEVSVTLDALPGVELKGKVDRIAPNATTVSGVVSYLVRVVLDATHATGAPLRTGMTANTSVVLERRENVLLAPNWAIRRDRQSNKSYLTIQVDEKTSQEVEVQTGLRNDSFSEILAGAKDGQVVLAPQAPSLLGQ
jgi:HlyD family secretion protein